MNPEMLSASFNNTRTLELKTQLTIAFFAAFNHNCVNSLGTFKNRNKEDTQSKFTNHQTWPCDQV